MDLRFDRSLGAVRLVQWNACELALTVRLGLRDLSHRLGSTNTVPVGRSRAPHLRITLPDVPADAAQTTLQRRQAPTEGVPQFHARPFHSIATVVVALMLGYVLGRGTSWQQGTVAAANAEEASEPSPAPEGMAPSIWASQINAVQEASWAPSPVEEVTILTFAPSPLSEFQPLSADEVREAQAWLNAFGFYSGPLDGLAGPQTMAAVRRYRIARKMEEMGGLDRSVLKQVRQQSGQ